MQMQEEVDDVVDRCLQETGAGKVSAQARDVALVGILVAPDGAIGTREYRRRIKETYLRYAPEYGSFFLLVILPIIVSLISHWLARWLFGQETTIRKMRSQAFDRLSASLPGFRDTHMSTNSLPKPPN